jgi:Fur family transcriptional regulator, peroxide stress response regulator
MQLITREELIRQLREKGLKITPQRLAIVDALVENRELHPGTNLIYAEALKRTKRVSLSTVYATLGEFSQQGLIKSLEFDRMENRYEGNLEEHINLVCRRCGKITDYPLPPSGLAKDIAREAGFVVTEARMEYYGNCRDCQPNLQEGPKGKQARANDV